MPNIPISTELEFDEDGFWIETVEGGVQICRLNQFLDFPCAEEEDAEQIDADACAFGRLFAAAPKLLATCQEALQREEDAGESAGSVRFIEQLREVIAIAKGELV